MSYDIFDVRGSAAVGAAVTASHYLDVAWEAAVDCPRFIVSPEEVWCLHPTAIVRY